MEEMFTTYILPELLVLVVVLYVVGMLIKKSERIADKLIPLLLGVIGIFIASLYEIVILGFGLEAIYNGIIQGLLCAGSAVYTREVYKQIRKKE
jgi:hypothetical protein